MAEHILTELSGHTLCLGGKVALKLGRNGVTVTALKLCVNVLKLHSGERKAGYDNLVLGAIKLYDLVTVLFLNLCKCIGKHLLLDLHNVLEGIDIGELKIEAGELGCVLVGIGLLCSENRAGLEDTLKACSHSHLLIELGRLCKVCKSVKILNLKYIGTGLTCSSDELGGVDLNEVALYEELAESIGKGGLHLECKLILLTTEVDPSVIHTNVDIGVILDRKCVSIGLYGHRGGIHLLAAHLYVLAGNNLTLEANNGVNAELVKHLGKLGVLLLFDGDLKLAGNVLNNDERHGSLVTEVFNKALNTANTGGYVFNVGSFHFVFSFII